jgi:hypothetical protein
VAPEPSAVNMLLNTLQVVVLGAPISHMRKRDDPKITTARREMADELLAKFDDMVKVQHRTLETLNDHRLQSSEENGAIRVDVQTVRGDVALVSAKVVQMDKRIDDIKRNTGETRRPA